MNNTGRCEWTTGYGNRKMRTGVIAIQVMFGKKSYEMDDAGR